MGYGWDNERRKNGRSWESFGENFIEKRDGYHKKFLLFVMVGPFCNYRFSNSRIVQKELFSHAEARKDGAEDFVGGHLAGDGAKVVEGIAEVDDHEVGRKV